MPFWPPLVKRSSPDILSNLSLYGHSRFSVNGRFESAVTLSNAPEFG